MWEDGMTEPLLRSGMLLFPNLTQLDLTGPYEVLARLPGAETRLVWKTLDPVRSENGLTILPDTPFADCPALDLILVPGGPGINPLLEDAEVLAFVRQMAAAARWVIGICTGSLVLGAAGLLRGRRAGTHWQSRELLRAFGAEPVAERVVVDGNVVTGGGVTAGIDVALTLAAEIAGRATAEAIQLAIEYDPAPPFAAGSPERADPAVVAQVSERAAARQRDRAERVARAARRLG
jgi:cyclohexyl-isocyanide hydratase